MSRGSTPRAAAASASEPTRPCRVTVNSMPDAVSAPDRAFLTTRGHRPSVGRGVRRLGDRDNHPVRASPPARPDTVQWTHVHDASSHGGAASGFRRMWHDLESLGPSTPRAAATTGSPGPARTTTCASGSPASAPSAASTSPTDRMGNQWAWWGDPDAAVAAGDPGVVIGSHLDSVPDGGAFDGPLGVVGALAAVDQLRPRRLRPDPPGRGRQLRRRGGRPVRRRLRRLPGHHRRARGRPGPRPHRPRRRDDGRGDARAPAATRPPSAATTRRSRRIGAFVELHVEQGRAPRRPRPLRRASAATSGRTAAGGSTCPARPTTPAPPRSTTARTPCSASPP